MGNHKFKLSDMIPNAWFFKLKDMRKSPTNKTRKHRYSPAPPPPPPPPSSATKTAATSPSNPELHCQSRKSYHFTRDLAVELSPEKTTHKHLVHFSPPRKSKSRKSTKKNPNSSSVSTTTNTTTATYDSRSPPEEPENSERFDIVIDVSKPYKAKGFDLDLPRIVTKLTEPRNLPTKSPPNLNDHDHRKISTTSSRRFSGSSPAGVRLKVNSPRIMARKQGQNGNFVGRKSLSSSSTASTSMSSSRRKRRSISESFAVVKSSRDPQKDFRESMVEMIVQNNLMGSKDLEDLLACYLSLNSDEYHDVIVKVFKQIWFDLIHLRQHKLVS